MKKITPKSRKDNLVVQELNGEILIYDLTDNKAYSLNETSALVWELCDGNSSITEISRSVSKKLKTTANEELVWLALDQLKKEKLIQNEEVIPATYEGMSRREVIKKVGFASMIALPLVSSVIAPSAINAQSVVSCNPGMGAQSIGTACTHTDQCGTFGGIPLCCWEVSMQCVYATGNPQPVCIC